MRPDTATATPTRAPDRRHRLLVGAVVALVAIVALVGNLGRIDTTRFHPDEARWIDRADYLTNLRHPLGEAWADRYILRGQPPFGSYVTGLGLVLQGRDTATNGPWEFTRGNEDAITWNVAHGNTPSWDDLRAARRTNAVIGALTCALLALLLARITGLAGALAGGLFLAANPLQQYLASTALSDATFGLLIVLSAHAALRLAERPTWGRALLLGVLLGCGMSAKLSPIGVAIGLAGIGLLFLIRPLLTRLPGLPGRLATAPAEPAARAARLGWMLLAMPALAATTFIALYPYLWPSPLGRTKILFDVRAYEMANQGRIWPNLKVHGPLDAAATLWRAFSGTYSTLGSLADGLPQIDAILGALGLVALLALVVRQGPVSRAAFVLYLVGGQALVVWLGLRVDFNRYYLPALVFLALCVGMLAGETPRAIAALVRRLRQRRRRAIAADPVAAP